MRRVALAAGLVLALARAALAQEAATAEPLPLRVGFGVAGATAMGTMDTYYANARGLSFSLRSSKAGLVRLRGDVDLVNFADETVTRPYNGTGPSIAITSGAEVMLLGAGAEVGHALGRFEGSLRAGAGGAYFHTSAATDSLGTSPQNQRANTYTTLTWQVQGGATIGLRLGPAAFAPRIELSARVVHAGETKFLREYNLPIGVISGLYAKPTPYAPTFALLTLGVTARL
jgi:hypothetical protein